MGQGCCVALDTSKNNGVLERFENPSSGWRNRVTTVLDLEQMDQVLNRWKQPEVLILQVCQLKMYANSIVCDTISSSESVEAVAYLGIVDQLCKKYAQILQPTEIFENAFNTISNRQLI
jgi:hypothetical protein